MSKMTRDEARQFMDFDPIEHPEYKTGMVIPIVRPSRWQRFLKRIGWRK